MTDPRSHGHPGAQPAIDEPAGYRDHGFLPASPPRTSAESVVVRLVATAGVIGIGTAIGAVMSAVGQAGWVIAAVVSFVSVVLAALLWRSRRL
jgi:hypothetical protein